MTEDKRTLRVDQLKQLIADIKDDTAIRICHEGIDFPIVDWDHDDEDGIMIFFLGGPYD